MNGSILQSLLDNKKRDAPYNMREQAYHGTIPGGRLNPDGTITRPTTRELVNAHGSRMLGRPWQIPDDWDQNLDFETYMKMVEGSDEYQKRKQTLGPGIPVPPYEKRPGVRIPEYQDRPFHWGEKPAQRLPEDYNGMNPIYIPREPGRDWSHGRPRKPVQMLPGDSYGMNPDYGKPTPRQPDMMYTQPAPGLWGQILSNILR